MSVSVLGSAADIVREHSRVRRRMEAAQRALRAIYEEADNHEDGAPDSHPASIAMTRVKAACLDAMTREELEA